MKKAKHTSTTGQLIRALHRDVGFFVIGLMAVYAVSGILLIYRNTDFLNVEKQVEVQLTTGLTCETLPQKLRLKNINPIQTEKDVISFSNGTYNIQTGIATYTIKEKPFPLNKLINLHKTNGTQPTHWFTTLFGISVLFLIISAFWMFPRRSSLFKRGIFLTVGGIIFTVILLYII